MKNISKYLALGAVAVSMAATSCVDEIVQDWSPSEIPANVQVYDSLNQLNALKDYLSSSNLKLALKVDDAKFVNHTDDYLLAASNFNQIAPSSYFMTAATVDIAGEIDYSKVSALVNDADAAGLSVFGHALTDYNGNSEYLSKKLVANDPDPNAKTEWTLEISQAEAKTNSWDTQVSVEWSKPLENNKEYTISFKVKADNAPGLQLDLSSTQSGNCANFGTSACTKTNNWENTYSSHSNVATYGVATDSDWKQVSVKLKTLEKADDGTVFNSYKKLSIGYGLLKGKMYIDDFKIYPSDGDPDADNVVANSDFEKDDITNWSSGSRVGFEPTTKVEYRQDFALEQRYIKLEIPKKKSQNWDSQLWIKSDGSHKFVKDATYKFHCLMKADKEFEFGGGIHAEADGNNWKASTPLSGTKATTEWTYYEKSGTFAQDYVGDNNTYSSFAFDLSTDDAHVLYLADVSLEINGDEVIKNGDFKTEDMSSFQWKRDSQFDTPIDIEESTSIKWYISEFEEVSGIPKTLDVKQGLLKKFMGNWLDGLMSATKGKVDSWVIATNVLAPEFKDATAKCDPNIAGASRSLQNSENTYEATTRGLFFWVEQMGKDYVKDLAKIAREQAGKNGVADVKLYVDDNELEDAEKLGALINWIKYWESDGTAKIDGIATQMHVNYSANEATQKATEDAIVAEFNTLKSTGKLVRISALDMGYLNASGKAVKTKNNTIAQQEKMAQFYKFIITKYLEIIPEAQRGGICIGTATDQVKGSSYRPEEPVGVWTSGYQRKPQYGGIAAGISAQ